MTFASRLAALTLAAMTFGALPALAQQPRPPQREAAQRCAGPLGGGRRDVVAVVELLGGRRELNVLRDHLRR